MLNRIVRVMSLAMPLVVATLSLLLSPVPKASGETPPAATADVKIDNFTFTPQTITVAAGTTVMWTNRDDIPHTVVSSDGAFKSKVRDTDETFSYKFDKAGTYVYYCSIHPKMTGKVIVQP